VAWEAQSKSTYIPIMDNLVAIRFTFVRSNYRR